MDRVAAVGLVVCDRIQILVGKLMGAALAALLIQLHRTLR